jgi:gamma-glutamyl-gamma-aminobutyrate hydrolase PuuD
VVGAGLGTSGWADDGTVEAIEGLDGHRVLGVQWHPELLLDDPGHAALFAWLVEEARRPDVVPAVPAAAPPSSAALASAAA